MKEYGFELTQLPRKDKDYNPIQSPITPFEQIINMTDDIRANDNMFVKRTRTEDLYRVKNNSGYRLLSSLNNIFVFRKK